MEKTEETINLFVASAKGVERDLEEWKKEGLPSDKEVQDEWEYFLDLLQIAKEDGVDTNPIVSEHAKICTAAFLKLVPEVAQATNG